MSTTGPYGVAQALASYLDANLETYVALVRTAYSETTDTLPRPRSAQLGPPWGVDASVAPAVYVAIYDVSGQDDPNDPTYQVTADVVVVCIDGLLGGDGADGHRAALEYIESMQRAFIAPCTLSNASGVLEARVVSAVVEPVPESSPTYLATVRVQVLYQGASS